MNWVKGVEGTTLHRGLRVQGVRWGHNRPTAKSVNINPSDTKPGNAKTDQINNGFDWPCSLFSAWKSTAPALWGQVITIAFLFHKKSYWISQISLVIIHSPKPSLDESEHSWFPIFREITASRAWSHLNQAQAKPDVLMARTHIPEANPPKAWRAFRGVTKHAPGPFYIAVTAAFLTEATPNCSDNRTYRFLSTSLK